MKFIWMYKIFLKKRSTGINPLLTGKTVSQFKNFFQTFLNQKEISGCKSFLLN